MARKTYFVEPRNDGMYTAKLGGAKRSSVVAPTQTATAAKVHQMDPAAIVLGARVRKTNVDHPDHWRKL
jgi:hypothetical protein